MFKKKCRNCKISLNRGFRFCPNCGLPLKNEKQEDYGLLGKDDDFEEFSDTFPGFGANMLNKMLTGAVKMLEKEMQKTMKETREMPPKSNFQLFINGKKVKLDDMQPGETKRVMIDKSIKREGLPIPSEEIIRKSLKLPREEANSKLKRISNKIIYEIEAPGIKTMDNILINKLEDSIEVRIFTKNKVLFKNLAVKLPLADYYLNKQKLFLEFKTK